MIWLHLYVGFSDASCYSSISKRSYLREAVLRSLNLVIIVLFSPPNPWSNSATLSTPFFFVLLLLLYLCVSLPFSKSAAFRLDFSLSAWVALRNEIKQSDCHLSPLVTSIPFKIQRIWDSSKLCWGLFEDCSPKRNYICSKTNEIILLSFPPDLWVHSL